MRKAQIGHGSRGGGAIAAGACVIALKVPSADKMCMRGKNALRDDLVTLHQIIGWYALIPLNRRYKEMTEKKRTVVRGLYTKMGPGDEPPFPAHGLAPIIRALSKGVGGLQVTGDLYLIVDVSSNGEAVSATAYGSPSPEMTRFAASVLLLTKFKPALCHWQPCAQKFPFNLRFELE